MTNQEYSKLVDSRSAPSPMGKNLVWAFLTGGLICTAGQGLLNGEKVVSLQICSENGKIRLAENGIFETLDKVRAQKVLEGKECKVLLTVKSGHENAWMAVSRKKKMEEQNETSAEIK